MWILQISFVAITTFNYLFSPWPMLFWALGTMITNAYFTYIDTSQASKTMTHKEFRLQCA